jgi:hypothetical protein
MIINEILPVPPSDFCRRLHGFDPELQINWDGGHKVWSIWHRNSTTGEISHVMNIINADGSFRELDERVFAQLRANRYFAQHPDELEEVLVDSISEKSDRDEAFIHDEMKHLSKDRYLNRKFKEIVENARGINWRDWMSPKALRDSGGNVLYNAKGEAVFYKPHSTLFENGGKKP